MNESAVSHQNLTERLLTPNLKRHPDKIAYLHNDQAISYRQLADAVYRVAGFLRDKGIQPGDRVLLALLDSPVFIAAFLGTAMVGAVAVAVNTSLSPELYGYIVDDCQARLALLSPTVADSGFPVDKAACLVCSESLMELLPGFPATPAHPEPVQTDDLAYMLYTSGSTGMPKGVPHRHADLLVAAENYAVQVLGMKSSDRVLSASKLFFGYGLGNIGHLQVRGPGCAPYYWNLPEKSAKTMLPDGFIRTGDVFLEQNGCYFHKGRSEDMLKVGGQWVSPIQVEEVLRSHPTAVDCAVAACHVGGLERVATAKQRVTKWLFL